MKKQKRTYPETFKEQAINLLRSSDRSAADIERELDITPGLLSRWNRKKDKQGGGVKSPRVNQPLANQPLDERVKQLERENARLRPEKEILKKAVAITSAAPVQASRTQTDEICLYRATPNRIRGESHV